MKTCADPNTPYNCELDWTFEQCGQVENSKFKYHGCKKERSFKYDHIQCLNRYEKAPVLFKNPPAPKDGNGRNEQATNYNQVLNFNATSGTIFCGQRNFSLDQLKELKEKYGNENCLLNDGQNVSLSDLWIYLKTDFSFKMSPKFDQL